VTTTDARSAPGPEVRAASRAVYLAFIGGGFAFANWAARIPQVRDALELDPSALGLVLLAIAAGSVLALPLSGSLIARIGSRRTVTTMSALLGVSLLLVAAGSTTSVPVLVVGLFVMGLANAGWDVGMNVQGAAVEQRLNKAIMSRFHAGWSLGTVAGALLGAAMVALDVPVPLHLAAVGVVIAVGVPLGVRGFLPDTAEGAVADPADRGSALDAWREPRTLLVGLVVLAFAFAEGAANDWLSVALIDDHGTTAAVGTLGFAVFLASMTVVRWSGPALLERHGRVQVVRSLAALAVVGLLVFVFGPTVWWAFAGVVLWGAGTSLGFPVGMSAAADDPARSAPRVSVVASIGYCAFLGGPPLIGFLGHEFTVLRAMVVVAVLLALATAIAGALRPPVARV
jgi:fucose permease